MDERRRSLLFAFGGGVACGMVDGVEAAQQAGVCAASTSIDAKQFGAIGDGHSHPARERFATLSECRARYPHAASLDDQIDGLAIQAAIDDALYFSKSPIVRIPAGVYRLSRPLHLGYGVPYGGTPYTTASLEGDGYDYAQQGAGTTLITEYSDALNAKRRGAVVGHRVPGAQCRVDRYTRLLARRGGARRNAGRQLDRSRTGTERIQ